MVAKILSLLNPLKKTFRSKLLKCVNPLLMGAVLAISVMEPLNIYAVDNSHITMQMRFGEMNNPAKLPDEVFEYTVYNPAIQAVTMVETPNQVSQFGSDKNVTVVSYVCDVPVYLLPIFGGNEYSGFYNLRYGMVFDRPIITVENSSFISLKFVGVPSVEIVGADNYDLRLNNGRYVLTHWLYDKYVYSNSATAATYLENFVIRIKFNVEFWSGTTNFEPDLVYSTSVKFNNVYLRGDNFYAERVANNSESGLLQEQIDNQEAYRNEDKTDAEQAGSDMTGFASQLDNLKNTWAILWYPIEFTNRFVEVFTGGTQAAAYQDEYTYVTGYRYNDENGFLEPIQSMSAQPQSAGTGITFPSFELMGYTIWESYTYDLSQVKEQVPEVFDAIYVIVSILEVLWFVGFLRSKYNEVFG